MCSNASSARSVPKIVCPYLLISKTFFSEFLFIRLLAVLLSSFHKTISNYYDMF